MDAWTQTDSFISTSSIERGGVAFKVVAVMCDAEPKATARVFARLPGGLETLVGSLESSESLDDALEAGKLLAIAHSDLLRSGVGEASGGAGSTHPVGL